MILSAFWSFVIFLDSQPLISGICGYGNLEMRGADCITRFYIRDLSILEFWYLQGPWNQSPVDVEGPTVFCFREERLTTRRSFSSLTAEREIGPSKCLKLGLRKLQHEKEAAS